MPYFIMVALSGGAEDLEGPVIFGDKDTAQKYIKLLKGTPAHQSQLYNKSEEMKFPYHDSFLSAFSPRQVMDKLERHGYELKFVSTNDDYTIWTMYSPRGGPDSKEPSSRRSTTSKANGIAKGMKHLSVKNGGGHVHDDGSGSQSSSNSGSGSSGEEEEGRAPSKLKNNSAARKSAKK